MVSIPAIVIHQNPNTIVDGHHRVAVLQGRRVHHRNTASQERCDKVAAIRVVVASPSSTTSRVPPPLSTPVTPTHKKVAMYTVNI